MIFTEMIKTFDEYLNESSTEEMYDVVMLGGSIGSRSLRSVKELKGEKAEARELLTKEEAKEKAKRMNKRLSPGEKKHYKIKYVIAQVIDGKYTGK